MEDVLKLYQRPRDVRFPVVNMDEQPLQLLGEKRAGLPMVAGRVRRVDHEYIRQGTASAFLFTEALAGWRKVSVRARRTAVDWAQEVKVLLEEVYPEAERVVLICDNLNTHKYTSLYKAFEAPEASELRDRLELHHTPKHGSWLNIAEIELSVFKRQCLWHQSDTRCRDASTGGGGVGIASQCRGKTCGLAIYHTRRTDSTKKTIPEI